MRKVNKRLKKQRQKEERQLSGGILPTSLWTHSRVNCQCDEESPVSQANHIWLVLMGGRLVTGSQETQATLISMPAKRAVCVCACVYVCVSVWPLVFLVQARVMRSKASEQGLSAGDRHSLVQQQSSDWVTHFRGLSRGKPFVTSRVCALE